MELEPGIALGRETGFQAASALKMPFHFEMNCPSPPSPILFLKPEQRG